MFDLLRKCSIFSFEFSNNFEKKKTYDHTRKMNDEEVSRKIRTFFSV